MNHKRVVLVGPVPVFIEGIRLIIRQYCLANQISCDIEIMPSDPAMLVRALCVRQPAVVILASCSSNWDYKPIISALSEFVPNIRILAFCLEPEHHALEVPLPAVAIAAGTATAEFLQLVFDNNAAGPVTSLTQQRREREALPVRNAWAAPELTVRQKDILGLLAAGIPLKEIAFELGISPRTVEFHKYKLMSILGIQSMVGLVRFAIESGIAAGRENIDSSDPAL